MGKLLNPPKPCFAHLLTRVLTINLMIHLCQGALGLSTGSNQNVMWDFISVQAIVLTFQSLSAGKRLTYTASPGPTSNTVLLSTPLVTVTVIVKQQEGSNVFPIIHCSASSSGSWIWHRVHMVKCHEDMKQQHVPVIPVMGADSHPPIHNMNHPVRTVHTAHPVTT